MSANLGRPESLPKMTTKQGEHHSESQSRGLW